MNAPLVNDQFYHITTTFRASPQVNRWRRKKVEGNGRNWRKLCEWKSISKRRKERGREKNYWSNLRDFSDCKNIFQYLVIYFTYPTKNIISRHCIISAESRNNFWLSYLWAHWQCILSLSLTSSLACVYKNLGCFDVLNGWKFTIAIHTHTFLSFTFNAFPFNSTSSIGCRLTRDDIEMEIEERGAIDERFPSDWPLFQFFELLANFSLSRNFLRAFRLVSRDLKLLKIYWKWSGLEIGMKERFKLL